MMSTFRRSVPTGFDPVPTARWHLKREMIFALALLLLLLPGTLRARKARPPVSLTWTTVQEADGPRPAVLRVDCVPARDVERFRLDVKIPATSRLVAGETSWEGPGRAGRVVSLEFSLLFADKGNRRVVATAVLPRGGKGRWVHAVAWGEERAEAARRKADGLRRPTAVLGRGVRASLGRRREP